MYLGIDIGGTFTDLAVYNKDGLKIVKVLTCPENPADSIFQALDELTCEEQPLKFLHSTTLVTNMILEHKGVKTAFITSTGMKDILHIGRHARPLNYAIKQEISHQHYPPCPEELRFTAPERIDFHGKEVIQFDEKCLSSIVSKLKKEQVKAIGIGFLHSHLYPENEIRAYEYFKKELPETFISLSEEVSPRFREFERFLTTAWNARVAPVVVKYFTSLLKNIKDRWPDLLVSFMTSNGGLEEIDITSKELKGDLRRTPIRLALSGPAAAGNAVKRISDDLSLACCVGLDVGGTSSDIVIVHDHKLKEAAWEDRKIGGYSLQMPMLDVHTIGAGGGSLISKDKYGVMHVGPESAGANPGPACYALGGNKSTLTDAAVISGRLPGKILLGGKIPINADLSTEVFSRQFNLKGDKEIIKTALESLLLAESNIACAIREKTVAKGIDPKELTLIAAGGAGPLFACGIADTLDIESIILPPRPGLLSAWGLLTAPERHEATITILKLLDNIENVSGYFKKAKDKLVKPPPSGAHTFFTASLRYLGQGFEVEIKMDEVLPPQNIKTLFKRAHKKEYGFSFDNVPVEWIDIRFIWEKHAEKWSFNKNENNNSKPFPEKFASIWELDSRKGKVSSRKAKLFSKHDLSAGKTIDGPAIIMEEDTTIFVASPWKATVLNENYIQLNRKH